MNKTKRKQTKISKEIFYRENNLNQKKTKVEKSPEKINNKKNKAKEDTKDVTKNKQKSSKS